MPRPIAQPSGHARRRSASLLDACAAAATVRAHGAHPGRRFGLVVLVTALEGEAPAATARNSVTVAGWTLVSRATGLLRLVVIGAVLGPTYFANRSRCRGPA